MAVVEKITYTSTPEQVAAMHGAFDEALVRVKANLGQAHPILINGEERIVHERSKRQVRLCLKRHF